jgi:competence protein ComEC
MLVPLALKSGSFAANKWLSARGQNEKMAVAAKRPLWTCDAATCKAAVRGKSVAVLKETAAVTKPCPVADVVIAQYPLRRRCRGRLVTIDRFDVWRNGAHALRFTATGVTVDTARGGQGQRPWRVSPRARAKNGEASPSPLA